MIAKRVGLSTRSEIDRARQMPQSLESWSGTNKSNRTGFHILTELGDAGQKEGGEVCRLQNESHVCSSRREQFLRKGDLVQFL